MVRTRIQHRDSCSGIQVSNRLANVSEDQWQQTPRNAEIFKDNSVRGSAAAAQKRPTVPLQECSLIAHALFFSKETAIRNSHSHD